MGPRKPKHLSEYARICLEALRDAGFGHALSIGGSLNDVVASKMVALVERGAPRDFRDISAVCRAALLSPRQCWELWRRRQEFAGSDSSWDRARLAVETHLARIARHRPLEIIEDPQDRSEAATVREWFRTEFLDALRD